MKKIIYLLAVLSILSTHYSFAASGSSGYIEIKEIRVGGGFLRVTGITEFNDPSDCNGSNTNKNNTTLVMEDTPSYKEILSFVLSAKMAKKKVQFWVNGCAADSGKNYPKALYAYIKD